MRAPGIHRPCGGNNLNEESMRRGEGEACRQIAYKEGEGAVPGS